MPPSLARVVDLPVRTASAGIRAVTDWSRNEVDDWGRDPDFAARLSLLAALRWRTTLGGERYLADVVAARRAGVLAVVNSRRFALTPLLTAFALSRAADRPVRFVGRPDTAPFGPLLQRLGGLLSNVDELTNALAEGEVVVIGTEPTLSPRRVGALDHRLVGAAVAAQARVLPVAAASSALQQVARVEIGREVVADRRRRGPLTELELADDVVRAIGRLLDEFNWNGWLLA